MTSHPSLSRNRISDLMKADSADSPRSLLSGISRWSEDQVETKRVLTQLVRMEYVPRKCGSACQETVAFIVSDVGGGAGSGERAMDSARLREIYMVAHRRVQGEGEGVENRTVDQVNREPGKLDDEWLYVRRRESSSCSPSTRPRPAP